ncbi:MAG TPA: HPr kinase/phosphatase C-terminal domain-containing protein [Stellaceae bacterium]
MNDRCLIHATAVAIDGRAVLLRGPSGSGKSDLALRLIDAGARLIADDQSQLERLGNQIVVRPPTAIAGLIEVRGIGIVKLAPVMEAPLALLADLVPAETIERLPAARLEQILGLELPLIAIAPFEASAVAKFRLALRVYGEGEFPALLKA